MKLKVSLKELFNIKGLVTKLGLIDNNFQYIPKKNCFIADLLSNRKDIEIVSKNDCLPFGVGEVDITKKDANNLSLGGSSTGAITMIQKQEADLCITTDTGGSTIYPAQRHNLIGFKPTYGRISRQGLNPHCSTLDTVAFISNCKKNIELLLEILSVKDPEDSTNEVLNVQKCNPSICYLAGSFNDQELGLIKSKYPELKPLKQSALNQNSFLEILLGAYYTELTPDFYSNLNRFNSVFQKDNYLSVKDYKLDEIIEKRSKGFNSQVKSRILCGHYLLKKYGSLFLKNTLKKFKEKLELTLGDNFLILPICKDVLQDSTFDQKEFQAPVWPIIANLLKRPSINLNIKGIKKGCFMVGPAHTDLQLIKFLKLQD